MKECLTPSQYYKEQFGKVIDFNMVVENKDEFAKVFAEGSDALESLLLYLWDTGIQTKACCAGHVVKPVFVKQILWIKKYVSEHEYFEHCNQKHYKQLFVSNPGYLVFYYSCDNMMNAAHLLRDMLFEECSDIPYHVSFSYDTISIYLDVALDRHVSDIFFNTIRNILPAWLAQLSPNNIQNSNCI